MRVPWRGLAVLASWFAWPVLYFGGYWLLNVALETGRRCSIEGCDPPDGLAGGVWLIGMLAVPAFLTYRWIRWRRSGHSSPAPSRSPSG